MTKRKSKTEEPTNQGSSLVPPRKKLRSQPTDVIVAVGQGDNQVEFECYKLFLCYNCEFFDTMLSLPMKENETSRIDLPDKDPEEWKLFYEFINPATANSAKVTKANAMILAPWFHEYQMNDLLEKCDTILYYHFNIDRDKLTVDNLETLLDTVNVYERYSLKKALGIAIHELSYFVSKAHHLLKDNLEILKRVFDIYKGHKEGIISLFYCQTEELFREIEENESADGEDIWENKYFRCMIKTKVENVILKIESEKLANY